MQEEDLHLDHQLMQEIKAGKSQAYDTLFRKYYAYLCMVVYRMIQDKNRAEDIVQEVMLEIWRKRETIEVRNAVKSYLHRAVRNKTLNQIRDQKMRFESEDQLAEVPAKQASALESIESEEMALILKKTYENLPEKCRIVFSLVKYEGFTYKEAAEKLEISVKTVENQISKALKRFREALENKNKKR